MAAADNSAPEVAAVAAPVANAAPPGPVKITLDNVIVTITPLTISGLAIPINEAPSWVVMRFLYLSNSSFITFTLLNSRLKLSHCFCKLFVMNFFSIFSLISLIYISFSMKFFDIFSICTSLNFSFILPSFLSPCSSPCLSPCSSSILFNSCNSNPCSLVSSFLISSNKPDKSTFFVLI